MNLFGFKISKKGGDPISTEDNELFREQFRTISAGMPISVTNQSETINNGYLKSDTVFSVINKLINLGNGVKWQLYEIKDKKAFAEYQRLNHKEQALPKYADLRSKALTEVETNRSIDNLLVKPNMYQSMSALWEHWARYYLITGNTYVYGLRRIPNNIKSPFISIHIPHPIETKLILSNNFASPVKGYKFDYYAKTVDASEVWHTKMFNPDWQESYHGLIGKSPLEIISNLVAVDVEGVANQAQKFANDGIRGILTGQGEQSTFIDDRGKIEELKKDYYRQMVGRISGLSRQIKDILFFKFPLQWLKIGQTSQEMDTVSSLVEVKKRIYAAYNVPYQDDPKYSNATVWRKDAIIGGLMPILEAYKEMLNMFLLKSWENELGVGKYYIDYDMISSFPELQDDMATIISAINNAEFMTLNDKRNIANLDPSENEYANELFISMGKIPLSKLDETLDAGTTTL